MILPRRRVSTNPLRTTNRGPIPADAEVLPRDCRNGLNAPNFLTREPRNPPHMRRRPAHAPSVTYVANPSLFSGCDAPEELLESGPDEDMITQLPQGGKGKRARPIEEGRHRPLWGCILRRNVG